jgi:hypothetical protein
LASYALYAALNRILKGDDGDDFDRQLWRLTDETIAEVYGDE